MRGSAIIMSRSRNSHMRAPRRVTLAPMAMPSRSLKPAIDFLARVVTARCPAMVESCSTASSSARVAAGDVEVLDQHAAVVGVRLEDAAAAAHVLAGAHLDEVALPDLQLGLGRRRH